MNVKSNNAGIYKIINLVDGKLYIGSSVRLRQRKHHHFSDLGKDKHSNNHLQNAYNKYGKDNFKWEVIEYVEFNEEKAVLKINLLEREQYYLDLFKCYDDSLGYNILAIAGSRLGDRHTKETKKRIGDFNRGKKRTEEQIKLLSESHKGIKLSKESIDKRTESREGYQHSEKTKEKMSLASLGRNKSETHCINMSKARKKRVINLDTGMIFESSIEASPIL